MKFNHCGFECRTRQNERLGTWCGYVGVAEGHPLYGKDYSEELDCLKEFATEYKGQTPSIDCTLDVHGGVTYADKTLWNDGAELWWIGFDCAHGGDVIPGIKLSFPGDTFKDEKYVIAECKKLAEQLLKIQQTHEQEGTHN